MAIELTETNQESLDAFLEGVLSAYSDGKVDLAQASAALAHVITAAAIDNEGEVLSWLKPERLADWKKECDAQRS